MSYYEGNLSYWNRAGGYEAPNVESWVFRWYGRILKGELGIDGSKGEKLLEFGCGSGAALHFFHRQGFEVYGVDISERDIERARQRTHEARDRIRVIRPEPDEHANYFGVKFDVVVGIQSFYYFHNTDFRKMIRGIYRQMNPGGIIYATMMGTKSQYYRESTDVGDGLRNVNTGNDRRAIHDYFIQFTQSEDDLVHKFELFTPIRIGHYEFVWQKEEGVEFHYMFTGRKPLDAP
jgi:cyclopropane fatty-acyl-phospholipid synthase-like methyltransferase